MNRRVRAADGHFFNNPAAGAGGWCGCAPCQGAECRKGMPKGCLAARVPRVRRVGGLGGRQMVAQGGCPGGG